MKKFQTLVNSTFSKQQQQRQQQQQGNQIPLKSQLISDENTPPPDPNIQATEPQNSLPILSKSKSPNKSLNSVQELQATAPNRCSQVSLDPSPPVKVVVRIRPASCPQRGADHTIKKVSDAVIRVDDREFCFDAVLDSSSKQEDVFRLVGEHLVQDALAGYNATIMSYGQTGSGKTYTMWGPPSAMIEAHSTNTQQGIVPRIFQKLFSDIEKEKANSNGKLINYQCRCSFLEIYNGQIGDLLDPGHRNLEIKDDAKNGFYIENLTEEYVTSYDEVIHILIKGLSNRKVGATSLNSKGSRSHVAFTFITESWSKDSPNTFSSSKTSRISLVDLAGLDRSKHADASIRHGKNVKRSLSQLGFLVNMLAKGVPPEGVAYRNSRLTQLLRESLGGNAKLSVICTISSDHKNHGETVSTLRFGQIARSIKNMPLVNEITEDDVNDLSDQIRQLKEELTRAKLDVFKDGDSSGQFNRTSIRQSVNQLRISLNRSLMLPTIADDLEERVDPNEVDVTELCEELENLRRSCEENPEEFSSECSVNFASARGSCDTYFTTEHERNCLHESVEVDSGDNSSRSVMPDSTCASATLEEPILSESPRIGQRKSITNESIWRSNGGDVLESPKLNTDLVGCSVGQSKRTKSSLHSSKIIAGPTESLAASLKRGLEILDYHQRSSQLGNSEVAFSFQHLTLRPSPTVDKANASVQTWSEGRPSLDSTPSSTFICVSCRQKVESAANAFQDRLQTQVVEANGKVNSDSLTKTVAMDAGEGSASAGNRPNDLQNVCSEQAAKIEELNRLLEQFKQEREFSSVSRQKREDDKSYNSTEEQPPEMIKEKCEIKRLDSEQGNGTSDVGEKEELLKEINTLKSRLQAYTESAQNKSIEKVRSSLLSRSIQLRKSMCSRDSTVEEMENERQRWIEMESEWINLTDELRIDLESIRQRSEKVEMELKLEKKCTEELDDALRRSVHGHARMVEHYVELQEEYNVLSEKYSRIMEGVAEVKKAAARAGTRCNKGSRFAKALAAELSALRVEREKERERLKKENKSLRIQLKDTAEAVHTAGELLVRLKEAEEATSVAETNVGNLQQENDRLKKQLEKLKRKHRMEMITMKQYMAESKLPESALRGMHLEEADAATSGFPERVEDDDQAWRAEFRSAYNDNY